MADRKNIRAKFRFPDGAEMTLYRDNAWTFTGNVPDEAKEWLDDLRPEIYVDPHLSDYSKYFEAVATATGAKLVSVTADSEPPADAVF